MHEAERIPQQPPDTRPGILLYYAYRPLPSDDREALAVWYEETCRALGLVGRLRVAWDGVNATLGE